MPLIDVSREDFEKEGLQYMIGRAPVLFDFLTSLPDGNQHRGPPPEEVAGRSLAASQGH